MVRQRVRIAIAALVGCWIAFSPALPPAEGKDPSRPSTTIGTPDTTTEGGCKEFCRTTPFKGCSGQPCQSVASKVHANGFCECLCMDKCDGAGRRLRK